METVLPAKFAFMMNFFLKDWVVIIARLWKKRRGEMLDHHVKHSQRQGSRNWNFWDHERSWFSAYDRTFIFKLTLFSCCEGCGVGGVCYRGGEKWDAECLERQCVVNRSNKGFSRSITAKLKGTVKSHCGYCTITAKSYEVQWNHTAVIVH